VVESVPLGLLANMKRLPSFALDLVRYLIADQQGDEQACWREVALQGPAATRFQAAGLSSCQVEQVGLPEWRGAFRNLLECAL